jgi:hypothetical protein
VKKKSRRNDEVTSDWSWNCHISFWKLWSFLWDAPVSKERLSKLVPNFTKKFPWGLESTPRWHTDFHDFQTLFAFPVIKIPTRPTLVAAPRSRNVWKFFPFLGQWMKTRKAIHKWFFRPSLPTPTCSCGWDLIYMHKIHSKIKKWFKYSKRSLKCVR